MRRLLVLFLSGLAFALVALFTGVAVAAPQATILRIDPRAANTDGQPILTTIVDVVQPKRLSDALADCAVMRGDAELACMSSKLSVPRALFAPVDFLDKNAVFTVTVDGADLPATFVDKRQWKDSTTVAGVGTAWLIMLDASMPAANVAEAQATALQFVNTMLPQDVADVMVFNDRQVISDSHWKNAAQKTDLTTIIQGATRYINEGRSRPLFTIIKNGVTDGFKDLGNAGSTIAVPYHQALVLLSSGAAGADTLSTGAGAAQLNQYVTQGRFPENNSALPKTPLPVVSILFPAAGLTEEFKKNAQDFMTNLANPEIGGYFNVVLHNPSAATGIVAAVRDRFSMLWVVRWRVSCIAPSVSQSFKLNFNNVNPAIAGDNSFKDVPVGIDPTTWPLDIDIKYTQTIANSHPVYPGGHFTVYGNFCWGGQQDRAIVYFLPANATPPAAVSATDVDGAKRAQKQLVAMGMDGKAVKASDSTVEFVAPDNTKIVLGSGEQAVSRIVVYDATAKRTSGVTATTLIQIKATTSAPINTIYIVVAVFGVVVLILLIVAIVRGGGGGGNKRRGGNPPPAPVGPGGGYPPPGGGGYPPGGGGYPPPGGGGPPPGYGGPPPGYGGGPPPGYGGPHASTAAPAYGAHPAAAFGTPSPAQAFAPVYVPPTAAAAPMFQQQPTPQPPPPAVSVNPSPASAQDFLYGGKPAQYGLTTAHPLASAPPPDPYANPASSAVPSGGTRATLSGPAGTYTVVPGAELRVGRDGTQCQIVLTEPRISTVHAIVRMERALLVRDEGSHNGTLVNGNRIAPGAWTPVPSGSMLRFGPAEFSVRIE